MNTLTRRDWLRLTATTALATPFVGHGADEDLRAKAKRNLKLAIFTGVYSRFPLEEAARRIKADGFSGVVLENNFADLHFDPFAPDWDVARKITEGLSRQGLKIVGLYGYYNVVDPDPAKRRRGEQRMELLINNWKRFECPNISTETGTFNPQSEWVESPENSTEKGFEQCRDALAKLARAAEKTGAIISIETYWRNVIDSASRAERVFREVNSPALKLVMDPCNFFRKEDLPRMKDLLEDIFRRVGRQTVLAHAKDVKGAADGTDLPAAGRGVLDYPLFLRLLAGLDRELYLAIEHLTFDDVARSRDYVLAQFEKI
jgi:sugar phosphate isomerase/epimerase